MEKIWPLVLWIIVIVAVIGLATHCSDKEIHQQHHGSLGRTEVSDQGFSG